MVAVVLCVACDKGRPAPPSGGSNHETNRAPAVMRVDASELALDAPPAPAHCSASTFGVSGPETQPKPTYGQGCELRDIRTQFQPPDFDEHALTARLDKSQWRKTAEGILLVELRSAADIHKIWRCASIPRIDWKREHVWVLVFTTSPNARREVAFVVDGSDHRVIVAMTNDHECVGYEAPNLLQQRDLVLPVGVTPDVRMCPDEGEDCGPYPRP